MTYAIVGVILVLLLIGTTIAMWWWRLSAKIAPYKDEVERLEGERTADQSGTEGVVVISRGDLQRGGSGDGRSG